VCDNDGNMSHQERLNQLLLELQQYQGELAHLNDRIHEIFAQRDRLLKKIDRAINEANRQLVETIDEESPQLQLDERVKTALASVDRSAFCPSPKFSVKYGKSPCPLFVPDATLSAPFIHAQALNLIQQHWDDIGYVPTDRTHILDVGSGSG